MTTHELGVEWAEFLKAYHAVGYKAHEVILFQGEVPNGALVVKKGMIKTYNLSESGEEQLVELETPGNVVPMPWVLGKVPSSLYYYEALVPCELYIVPREAYITFLRSNSVALFAQLEQAVLKDLGHTLRLNALLQSKASNKILSTLHYLSQTQSTPIDSTFVEISVSLTHQDLANLTGLTRETTATEINKLKRLGVLRYQKRSIYHINIPKLKSLLNDQFIADSEISF